MPKLINKKTIQQALQRAKELEKKHINSKEELASHEKLFLKQSKKALNLLEKIEEGYKKKKK
tara:strand:- start:5918 stop:6103 length:186 start_codon:yes stop_codon:yes gene_type:complete